MRLILLNVWDQIGFSYIRSLKEFFKTFVFAANLAAFAAFHVDNITSDAGGWRVLAPVLAWSFFNWACFLFRSHITCLTQAVVVAANLTGIITGIICRRSSYARTVTGLTPVGCWSFHNWACSFGWLRWRRCWCWGWSWVWTWMPLAVINLVEKFHPVVNSEWYAVKVDTIDENCWGCVHSLGSGVFPHFSNSPLRIVSIIWSV